ncbi:MAG: hypothetical protein RIQ33_1221, partial [Bacteroidota bacterium]
QEWVNENGYIETKKLVGESLK